MSMAIRGVSLASILSLSLAACAATPTGDDAASLPPGSTAGCNAEAAQSAVGKQATDEVIEQARQDAGAQVARVLKPGQMVTMEFREGRLNLQVDASNVVTEVRCG